MHICKLSAGNQEKGYVMACLDGPSSWIQEIQVYWEILSPKNKV